MTRQAPDENQLREIVLRVINEMNSEQAPEEVKEVKEAKPKKKLTEKQLAALAAGRAKNPKFKPRTQYVRTNYF